ncbi:MAG: thioredoxin [Acidimicrobiia bacterium]|nr:thioredoxin [Acidimicrobiia bacterium]NNL27871.1 thioredoxin [Acidimicrobiia bacterium]
MATITATSENIESLITENDTVIIDFWAEWCGPCRGFAPTFESASEEHEDIVFAKVDTEDQQALAQEFNIRSIPTLMVFRDQVLLYNEAGALPPQMLGDLISQVKGLDMDDVRRQIEEHGDGHDHAGEDQAGQDHAGHDHAGQDHA